MVHGKFIQISAAINSNNVHVLYALDEDGRIYEKIAQQAWSIVE